MKKLKANIKLQISKIDQKFRALPLKKQHQYTLYFFIGYLLITAGVICQVWYETSKSKVKYNIKHIENSLLKHQQSHTNIENSLIFLRNKIYERNY